MKRMKKVKKMIMSVAIAIMLLLGKTVQAITPDITDLPDMLYGPPQTVSGTVWRISKIFVIPLALIIGFIIYFKKSKSTTTQKILTIIIVILLIFIVICGSIL